MSSGVGVLVTSSAAAQRPSSRCNWAYTAVLNGTNIPVSNVLCAPLVIIDDIFSGTFPMSQRGSVMTI